MMSSAERSLPVPDAENIAAMQDTPVRKTVTVKSSQKRAFEAFTAGFDSWWPRSHHIGTVPMKKAIIEGHLGGRCYSEQTDGSECDWGEITLWEPPQRLIIAWKINVNWQYEPDTAKSSEVEVRFTPLADGSTRVDLEHRNFARMGPGWETMRGMVDSAGGWGGLLTAFAAEAEKSS
jgi:uncharacterized protein YndB with AHSA1/START domain